jgi:hypothetical protein
MPSAHQRRCRLNLQVWGSFGRLSIRSLQCCPVPSARLMLFFPFDYLTIYGKMPHDQRDTVLIVLITAEPSLDPWTRSCSCAARNYFDKSTIQQSRTRNLTRSWRKILSHKSAEPLDTMRLLNRMDHRSQSRVLGWHLPSWLHVRTKPDKTLEPDKEVKAFAERSTSAHGLSTWGASAVSPAIIPAKGLMALLLGLEVDPERHQVLHLPRNIGDDSHFGVFAMKH